MNKASHPSNPLNSPNFPESSNLPNLPNPSYNTYSFYSLYKNYSNYPLLSRLPKTTKNPPCYHTIKSPSLRSYIRNEPHTQSTDMASPHPPSPRPRHSFALRLQSGDTGPLQPGHLLCLCPARPPATSPCTTVPSAPSRRPPAPFPSGQLPPAATHCRSRPHTHRMELPPRRMPPCRHRHCPARYSARYAPPAAPITRDIGQLPISH